MILKLQNKPMLKARNVATLRVSNGNESSEVENVHSDVGLWSKSRKMIDYVSKEIPYVKFLESVPHVSVLDGTYFCGLCIA